MSNKIGKLKPFRDYSEHDVNNLFALNSATGAKGSPVVIDGSGFINNKSFGTAYNLTDQPNVYVPRYEVKSKVRLAASGEKPFGIMLYDVKEVNQFGYPLMFDSTRKAEAQAVVSGEAVSVVRKGMFVVGPFASGEVPAPGKVAVVKGTGDWGVADPTASGYNSNGTFGEFIGAKDADGYAPVYINCYR